MWKNIWDKENSEKRPYKNFPLQKHFASTKNFKGQKQQLWNGVWTSNHTKVKFIYYSLWWSTFFPIFTRLAYENDFLNLGVAILLLVAVALHLSSVASNQALPALDTSHATCCYLYWRRLSRAVVVNSNMSRGKYLAREGPGSRLLSSAAAFRLL